MTCHKSPPTIEDTDQGRHNHIVQKADHGWHDPIVEKAEAADKAAIDNEGEFEKVRKISKGYLLANMTEFVKSKLLNKSELEKLGYSLVIYPVTTQRLAMKNVEDGLKSILKDGDQNKINDNKQTDKRLYEIVEYEKYNTTDNKITDFSTEGH